MFGVSGLLQDLTNYIHTMIDFEDMFVTILCFEDIQYRLENGATVYSGQ